MYPYLFGAERLPMYGILMVLGGALAIAVGVAVPHKNSVKRLDLFFCALFAFVGGIVGAKLCSIFANLKYVIAGLVDILTLIRSGFVFYGGLVGGLLGALAYLKIYKLNVLEYFDAMAAALPLGHALGRLGCFCSGCCYGVPTSSPIGIIFTNPYNIATPVGVPLVPTQLIEVFALLAIFVILMTLSQRKHRSGTIAVGYALLYAVSRFIIEFWRGDVARLLNNSMTGSQIFSLVLFTVALVALALYIAKRVRVGHIAKAEPYVRETRL